MNSASAAMVAVTARGANPDCVVDESFGRAYWFLLYDGVAQRWEALDNSVIRNQLEGAGLSACRQLSGFGVAVLITGQAGPKALRELGRAGIAIYRAHGCTAREAVIAWQQGLLAEIDSVRCWGSPYCLASPGDRPLPGEAPNLKLIISY